MNPLRGIVILGQRLSKQGLRPTVLWAADHAVRIASGAPLRRVSQITPYLHVGGQYRRRGCARLASRGIRAVVNMRIEYDDREKGVAPDLYLHLATIDDHAPTLEQLELGVRFIEERVAAGDGVLVHCGSGVGRAATMAAAYLIDTGLAADQAWATIRAVRPFIRPTPPQIEQIERFAARGGQV